MKRFVIISVLCLSAFSLAKDKEKLSADEIIARHLESIGSSQARQAAASREITGSAHMQQLVGGVGTVDGQSLVLSEGTKVKIGMKFSVRDYPQEQFVFDGKQVLISRVTPVSRSAVGEFLFSQPAILKEGLLGGTLSAAWPLMDTSARKAKFSYDGLKKVGDRQLHQVTYQSKSVADRLTIKLYFEPDTFRHVMTLYTFTRGLETTVDMARSEYIQELQETFDQFRSVNGLTLPTSYSLRYTDQQNAGTKMWSWQLTLDQFNGAPFGPIAGK